MSHLSPHFEEMEMEALSLKTSPLTTAMSSLSLKALQMYVPADTDVLAQMGNTLSFYKNLGFALSVKGEAIWKVTQYIHVLKKQI